MYDIPKAALLKSLVAITSLLWLFWISFYKQTERLKRILPIALPLGLLAITFIISSCLGHPPITSFEGVYERQMGLLGYFAAVMLTLLLVTTTDSSTEKKVIIYLILGSSLILALHGLFSFFSLLNWPKGAVNGGRLAGLMGNANFMANQLVIALPLSFLLTKKKALNITIFLTCLTAIILTQTRGAFFAILITGVFFLFHIATNKKYGKKLNQLGLFFTITLLSLFGGGLILSYPQNIILIILCLVLFVGSTLFFSKKYLLTENKVVFIFSPIMLSLVLLFSLKAVEHQAYLKQYNPDISFSRFIIAPEKKEGTSQPLNQAEQLTKRLFSSFKFFSQNSRVLIWKDTLQFVSHNGVSSFLFGIGLENFRRDFMPFKSAEAEKRSKNIHFDNPHNSILYYLASVGLIGTILIGFLLFRIWRICSSNAETSLMLKSTLVIYLAAAFTNVDMIASLATMGGILAIILLNNKSKVKNSSLIFHKSSLLFSLILIIFFSLWNLTSSIKTYRADRYYYQALSERNPSHAIRFFNQAITTNKNEAQYYQAKAEFLLKFVPKMPTRKRKIKLVQQIDQTLRKAISFSWQPENHYITLYNAKMAIRDIDGAKKALVDCLRISPHLIGVQKAYYRLQGIK